VDDRYGQIYLPGQMWLSRSDIRGRVKGYVPLAGYATILFNEYPSAKYAMVVGLAILTIAL